MREGSDNARGSSPLARGLLPRLPLDIDADRIIPARAGFTASSGTGRTQAPDHPRSRGVYSGCALDVHRMPGSSPLARGLLVVLAAVLDMSGIIPARAGFT